MSDICLSQWALHCISLEAAGWDFSHHYYQWDLIACYLHLFLNSRSGSEDLLAQLIHTLDKNVEIVPHGRWTKEVIRLILVHMHSSAWWQLPLLSSKQEWETQGYWFTKFQSNQIHLFNLFFFCKALLQND